MSSINSPPALHLQLPEDYPQVFSLSYKHETSKVTFDKNQYFYDFIHYLKNIFKVVHLYLYLLSCLNRDKGWIKELFQEAIRISRMNRFYNVVTFFDHDFIAKISSMTLGRFGWLKLSPVAGIR